MVDASLTRVFFSFSVFLICALFVGIEINRAMRRGVGKTLITLATIVSSIITGILLSRFASSILTRYIIEYVKQRTSTDAYIGGSINMEYIVSMFIQAALSSVLFVLSFILCRICIGAIIGAISRRKLRSKKDARIREDKTAKGRRERICSILAGAVCGIIFTAAITSPVLGAMGLLRSAVNVVDDTDLNVWNTIKLDEVQVKKAVGYTQNLPSVLVYSMGGRMIYTASATATLDGKLVSVPAEMRILEEHISKLGDAIKLFESTETLTEEEMEIFEGICELTEKSEIFKYFLAEYIQKGTSTWLRNGKFMSVAYPSVSSQFRELFDEVLRICSGTSAHTVSTDVNTLVNIYSDIISCAEHENAVKAILYSEVMKNIEESISQNPRMNTTSVRNEIYDLTILSIVFEISGGRPAEFMRHSSLAENITAALNEVRADDKLTRDEVLEELSAGIDESFKEDGFEFSDSTSFLTAEALVNAFGRSGNAVETSAVLKFFSSRFDASYVPDIPTNIPEIEPPAIDTDNIPEVDEPILDPRWN